jgi:antitoxin CcdA
MADTPNQVTRRATNITLPEALLREAKALKVTMSQACERGLAAEVARARREVWLAENRAAMDAWNAHVAAHGMPLAQYRRF